MTNDPAEPLLSDPAESNKPTLVALKSSAVSQRRRLSLRRRKRRLSKAERDADRPFRAHRKSLELLRKVLRGKPKKIQRWRDY